MATKSRQSQDPKAKALGAQGTLNPHASRVQDEQFLRGGFFDPRDLLQVKYEMVRRVLSDDWSPTASAKAFGFSRATFYATKEAFERGGLAGLLPKKPGPKGPHKITGEILEFARALLAERPDRGSQDLADAISSKFAVRVHPRSVERALQRPAKKNGPGLHAEDG